MFFPFGPVGVAMQTQKDRDVFTKEDYTTLVKKNRKEYVHRYFLDVLRPLFEELKIDAIEMKICRREVVFEVPEHFSISKTEAVLCSYFSDLGFKPLVENRKETDAQTKITITIT